MGETRSPAPALPDLAELRALCVAADLGTIGRAAVRLRVAQPTLSRRLRSLEERVGVQLFERSQHGVKLTAPGRRVYERASELLAAADSVAEELSGLQRRAEGPIRLACSHSALDAFMADMLATANERGPLAIELFSANSQRVRSLVADGRADVGVAASRPRHTPNPAVRELELAPDAIVCAVPPAHPWASRRRVRLDRFLSTPMVLRDAQSNARWTVDSVLRERGLTLAAPLVEAPTSHSAIRQARSRCAPLLVSEHALTGSDLVIVGLPDLAFPRVFELVLPAYGEPTGDVAELVYRIRDHVRIWLR